MYHQLKGKDERGDFTEMQAPLILHPKVCPELKFEMQFPIGLTSFAGRHRGDEILYRGGWHHMTCYTSESRCSNQSLSKPSTPMVFKQSHVGDG